MKTHPSPEPLPAPLTPDAAFVVQVRKDGERLQGTLEGRVEHVLSGSACTFTSLDELEEFIRRTVAEQGGDRTRDRADNHVWEKKS